MAKISTPSLFPILSPQPTGIARLAAIARHADDGHLIEFKELEVRSILNKTISRRGLPIAYSINPYRGCEFGCKYCYARYTHEFMAPKLPPSNTEEPHPAPGLNDPDFNDPKTFERLIFIKQHAAWLLEQELKKIDPAEQIALGTATDPYQPIERRTRLTRSLLEVFSRKEGYRLGIITKSRLIERDIDLLREIARRNRLTVHITITTPDATLARLLEPRAPRPDLRFRAVKRLREAGLRTGILCCPLLPGITDSEEAIDTMVSRAAEAGACFMAANPLFLKPCSRPTYLSFIREHFPALEPDYLKRYGNADFVSLDYRRKIETIVAKACLRHKLGERQHEDTPQTSEEATAKRPPQSAGPAIQIKLFA